MPSLGSVVKGTFVVFIILVVYILFVHKLAPQDQPIAYTFGPSITLNIPTPQNDHFLHTETKYLTDPKRLFSPEDVQVDEYGSIYSGLADGSIIKIDNEDLQTLKVLVKRKGAILGIGISLNRKSLIFISSVQGLCSLDLKTLEVKVLLSQRNGKKFSQTTPNSFSESINGKIYFTQATDKFQLHDYMKDVMRGHGRGSLLSFDQKTKQVQVIYTGLHFANGVVAEQQNWDSVLVAQTAKFRIRRIWVEGPKKGQSEILIDNLPGAPDNIKLNHDHQLLIGMPYWKTALQEFIFTGTKIRKLIIVLGLQKAFERFANNQYAGGVKVNTKTGKIVEYLIGTNKYVSTTTTILERHGKYYLASLKSPTITVVDHTLILDQKIRKENEKDYVQDL